MKAASCHIPHCNRLSPVDHAYTAYGQPKADAGNSEQHDQADALRPGHRIGVLRRADAERIIDGHAIPPSRQQLANHNQRAGHDRRGERHAGSEHDDQAHHVRR